MSLEEKINDQYGQRSSKDVLYQGIYSRKAFEERSARIKKLMRGIRRPGDTVLEIGAGHGDNVSLLLNCGFSEKEIFLNEMLAPRVANIRQRYPGIVLFEGNALELDPGRRFSCVFQSTVFTSILEEDDRRRLAAKMWQLLEPGGVVLWYDFIYNNPSNKNVRGVGFTETRSLFPLASRSSFQRVTLAPPIGRRVGNLYGLFNLPFLRSHILAVFHKPL